MLEIVENIIIGKSRRSREKAWVRVRNFDRESANVREHFRTDYRYDRTTEVPEIQDVEGLKSIAPPTTGQTAGPK